jgi:hypothetical protein
MDALQHRGNSAGLRFGICHANEWLLLFGLPSARSQPRNLRTRVICCTPWQLAAWTYTGGQFNQFCESIPPPKLARGNVFERALHQRDDRDLLTSNLSSRLTLDL